MRGTRRAVWCDPEMAAIAAALIFLAALISSWNFGFPGTVVGLGGFAVVLAAIHARQLSPAVRTLIFFLGMAAMAWGGWLDFGSPPASGQSPHYLGPPR